MPITEWTTNVPPPPAVGPSVAVPSLAVPSLAVPAAVAQTTVIGPLATSSGFKFWYFVCDGDAIIAAQVPFKHGLFSALPYAVAPFFGLLGGLFFSDFEKTADRANNKVVAELQRRPNRLKYAPNKTFKIHDLRSIQTKRGLVGAGGYGAQDIILEKANGTKMAFGAQPRACGKFCLQLQKLYPNLFMVQ
jgi:hypothetical protein